MYKPHKGHVTKTIFVILSHFLSSQPVIKTPTFHGGAHTVRRQLSRVTALNLTSVYAWRGRVGHGIFRSAVAMDPPFATKVTVCDQNKKSGGEGARRKRGRCY